MRMYKRGDERGTLCGAEDGMVGGRVTCSNCLILMGAGSVPCANAEWVAAHPEHSLEWARGMWACDCPACQVTA